MKNTENRLTPSHGSSAPSVRTAFDILDILAASHGPARMAHIAQQLSLPKSTAFRILSALEAADAVIRNDRDKQYTLGHKFHRYARAAPLPDIATRFMDHAAPILRSLNETVQLGVLTGNNVTFLACIDSTKPVRLVSHVGRTLPVHASATGKAILAFSSAQDVQAVIDAGLPALTERTITQPHLFTQELDAARHRGYATEEEESTANLSCIAAPILDSTGRAQGAITVCIPRSRLPENDLDQIRTTVLEACKRIPCE